MQVAMTILIMMTEIIIQASGGSIVIFVETVTKVQSVPVVSMVYILVFLFIIPL